MEQDRSQSQAIKSDILSSNSWNTAVDEERGLVQMMSSYQLEQLVRSLKEVIELQRLAMEAQIDAREKRREAGFKRRDVWTRDAIFMKELQALVAKDRLEGFGELTKLAA